MVVNLTATQANLSGHVTAFPCGGSAPVVSNLNFTPNAIVANLAIVKLSAGGQLCLVSNTDVEVIADVTAYLTADTSITALPPTRIYDSREQVDPHCDIGVQTIHDGFQVLDLGTGAPLGTLPSNNAQFPRVYVRADCQTIDVVGFVSSPAQEWWWQYSPSGVLLATRQLAGHVSNVMFTDTGPLVIQLVPPGGPRSTVAPWQIVDLTTGQLLFSLPDLTPATDGLPRA